MSARVLEGLRLSDLARCGRMCAMRGLGAVPADPTPQAKRWMSRGNYFGWYAYRQFQTRYGERDVEREREIDWELGTGHADIYVRSEKLLVEVVSSVSPDAIFPSKVRQVKQYLHFDPDAERAAVYVIDPSTLDREDIYPVKLRPSDVEEIEAGVESVRQALAGGPLPECCAASPTECRHSYFCPFTEDAWEGWEPPAPSVVLDGDADAIEAVRALYTVKERRRRWQGSDTGDEMMQKELQAQLTELGVIPGLPYRIGGFELKRTHVTGRETFSWAKAKEAGLVDEELLAPFVRRGDGYDTYSVKLLEGALAPDDEDLAGDVPF